MNSIEFSLYLICVGVYVKALKEFTESSRVLPEPSRILKKNWTRQSKASNWKKRKLGSILNKSNTSLGPKNSNRAESSQAVQSSYISYSSPIHEITHNLIPKSHPIFTWFTPRSHALVLFFYTINKTTHILVFWKMHIGV